MYGGSALQDWYGYVTVVRCQHLWCLLYAIFKGHGGGECYLWCALSWGVQLKFVCSLLFYVSLQLLLDQPQLPTPSSPTAEQSHVNHQPTQTYYQHVVHAYRYAASYNKHRTYINTTRYKQGIQVTPHYGYIYQQWNITLPSDNYQHSVNRQLLNRFVTRSPNCQLRR